MQQFIPPRRFQFHIDDIGEDSSCGQEQQQQQQEDARPPPILSTGGFRSANGNRASGDVSMFPPKLKMFATRKSTGDSRVTFQDNVNTTMSHNNENKKEVIIAYEDDASKLQSIFHRLHKRDTYGTKTWYNLTRTLEHFLVDDPKRCKRSAERQRDISERTYLHAVLMNDPPVQVVRLLVRISPASVQLLDYHGMTPLHVATNYTASLEVQECLVKEYPEALSIQDELGRVPLHYVFDPLILDEALAKAYRRQSTLNINTNGFGDYRDDTNEEDEDDFGIDDSHAAMAQARPNLRASGKMTVKQARRLVGRQKGYFARVALLTVPEAVFLKDGGLKTPFRLFCRISKSVRHSEAVFLDRMRRILIFLLDCDPKDSNEELIEELRHLPYALLDVAIKHPLTHGVVNEKTSHSIFASLFLLDLVVQIILIVGFTFLVTDTTWVIKGDVYDPNVLPIFTPAHIRALTPLAVGLGISIFRLALEIGASIRRNNFRSWISDFWNVLNLLNVWLVLLATSQIAEQKCVVDQSSTYILTLIAGGVQWVALITILRLAWMPFSIFVTGTLQVARGLVPFSVVSFFLLGAYSFMFYIATIDECNKGGVDRHIDKSLNEFTCTFRSSFLTMFSWRFGAGIPAEAFFHFDSDIMILTIFFAIIFTLLMANVLIAVVVDQYLVAKENGELMFWRFRFEGLANAEAIRSMTRSLTVDFCEGSASTKDKLEAWWEDASWCLAAPMNNSKAQKDKRRCAQLRHATKTGLVFVGLALWCLIGLVTLGMLWPPQVIDYLFSPPGSKDETAAAKKKEAKEKQQQAEQFTDLKQQMEHFEDQAEELRALQVRLSKDLKEVKKGFTLEMKYVGTQMSDLQTSLHKIAKVLRAE